MRQIRSRTIAAAAIALSLAFVAHAGATATYDYKPGQFLVIEGGASPYKKFSIVTGENKAGEFGVCLRVRQNSSYSAIAKWISPTRFVVGEECQWQVKERDPSATIGQYGEAETLEQESGDSAALYNVSFDVEGECELLPADKTRVLSTQPVKEQKASE